MKYYAVKKGRKPGVYKTWDEAKKQVDGFSNAEYKSFNNVIDAIKFAEIKIQPSNIDDAIQKIKQTSKDLKQKSGPKTDQKYYATIYTDGGSRNTGVYKGGHVNKTDKAAWAYLIVQGKNKIHQAGGEFGATNNKMEQTALIEALKKLIELNYNDRKLHFILDSQYVLNAINKHWLESWHKLGWKKKSGALKNAEQWQEMYQLLKQFSDTQFDWTKGHAKNYGNNFVDSELNKYMDQM